MKPQTHKRTDNSLVYPRCYCGWRGEVEKLKGKTDQQLWEESHSLFCDHVLEYEKAMEER